MEIYSNCLKYLYVKGFIHLLVKIHQIFCEIVSKGCVSNALPVINYPTRNQWLWLLFERTLRQFQTTQHVVVDVEIFWRNQCFLIGIHIQCVSSVICKVGTIHPVPLKENTYAKISRLSPKNVNVLNPWLLDNN